MYFKPTPNDLLEGNDKMLGYANIMKSLTISEEHKLRLEVKQLTKEQDEIAIMKLGTPKANQGIASRIGTTADPQGHTDKRRTSEGAWIRLERPWNKFLIPLGNCFICPLT